MSARIERTGRARAGFTVVEVAVAGASMAMLWVALAGALRSGVRSQDELFGQSERIEERRRSSDMLREDLQATSRARMTAGEQVDGSYVLELQHPVRVEGVEVWGVRTAGARADADTNGDAGWSIRYVAGGADADGTVPLRRQVIDEEEEVQSEEVVARVGRDLTGKPGFAVDAEGEMASIHILRANHDNAHQCQETSFHVRIRN